MFAFLGRDRYFAPPEIRDRIEHLRDEETVADIFREVDEELQQERAAKLWSRYGGWVITVAVTIVLGVAGNVYWTKYEADQRAEQSAVLEAALQPLGEDRPEAAAEALAAFIPEAQTGYATLARFQEAAALEAAGDADAALVIYRTLIDAEDTPAPYGALAAVKLVRLSIGSSSAAELRPLLEPALAATSPWRPLARETEAILALADGDRAGARAILEELVQDQEIPASLRNRATELVAAIGGPDR